MLCTLQTWAPCPLWGPCLHCLGCHMCYAPLGDGLILLPGQAARGAQSPPDIPGVGRDLSTIFSLSIY